MNSLKNVLLRTSTPFTAASSSASFTAFAWLMRARRFRPASPSSVMWIVKASAAQPRIGADVRRRLVAADMLLAGRQRQHEAAVAVRVHRLAAEAARHLADIFRLRGEETDIRPAEIQRVADRLALAHHDVGAHARRAISSRPSDTASVNTAISSAPCWCALSAIAFQVAHVAEHVRRLHDDAGQRVVDLRQDSSVAPTSGASATTRRSPSSDNVCTTST